MLIDLESMLKSIEVATKVLALVWRLMAIKKFVKTILRSLVILTI